MKILIALGLSLTLLAACATMPVPAPTVKATYGIKDFVEQFIPAPDCDEQWRINKDFCPSEA